ncbi:MAG TPA: cytochrome C oxidase subunit IV family protein [Terriglobales bacterium]|nr:cytochrome C oxidase subunit IV family protein [Terriglobales bacterium]
MATAESQSWSLARYLVIYVCVLIIAGLQFVVAYQHLDISQMFLRMLMLATVEAGLAVLFFMHLWTERRTFVVTVIVGLIFVLGMMNMIWWDSFRLLRFRLLP